MHVAMRAVMLVDGEHAVHGEVIAMRSRKMESKAAERRVETAVMLLRGRLSMTKSVIRQHQSQSIGR